MIVSKGVAYGDVYAIEIGGVGSGRRLIGTITCGHIGSFPANVSTANTTKLKAQPFAAPPNDEGDCCHSPTPYANLAIGLPRLTSKIDPSHVAHGTMVRQEHGPWKLHMGPECIASPAA